MSDLYVARLVQYGIESGLIPEEERIYSTNQILEVMKKDDYEAPTAEEVGTEIDLADTLGHLLDEALESGVLEDGGIVSRDLFDTKLMNCLTPRPAQVIAKFREDYAENPKKATDHYYNFSVATNYIRKDRIAKDRRWKVPSEYGEIDITINLSKPEKDPKAIAAAKLAKQSAYPKCQLCVENEGYAGRLNHPARQNHRIIPITINGGNWGFQYSPYVYYNEHCIVFNGEHTPMKIERATFRKLFDFVKQFPHYFLGSNADLPIVGGSILSHDHFQGGHYTFAMEKAEFEKNITIPGFEDVEAGIVHWPLSVIRIRSNDDERLVELADHILKAWRGYTDEDAFVLQRQMENRIIRSHRSRVCVMANMSWIWHCVTISPRKNARWVYIIRMQSCITIKKENIGLIEVMGACGTSGPSEKMRWMSWLPIFWKAKTSVPMRPLKNMQTG